ncbi:hypothetical protein AB4Z50_04515 [Paenibacillus sp. 2TAB26]|uniref:hypothetical protein n=1 Tax=Paenibacillus sp. 2TAB26 TaxID=3233005 RepID=UPI003F9E1F79
MAFSSFHNYYILSSSRFSSIIGVRLANQMLLHCNKKRLSPAEFSVQGTVFLLLEA